MDSTANTTDKNSSLTQHQDLHETRLNRTVAKGTQEFPLHKYFLWQVNVICILYCPKQARQ